MIRYSEENLGDPAAAQTVVVLVHGTWAQGSTWPELEATLREALRAPVHVAYEDWSGHNWLGDRRAAVGALQRDLARLASESPRAQQYIIAHSHGGNVALRAVKDPALHTRLRGVICLSTPFLDARLRRLSADEIAFLLAGIPVAAVLTAIALSLTVGSPWPWLLVLLSVAMLARHSTTDLEARATALRDDVSAPALDHLRLLIVRSPADEALLSLIAAQLVRSLLAIWEVVSAKAFRTFMNAEQNPSPRGMRIGWNWLALLAGLAAIVLLLYVAQWGLPFTYRQAWDSPGMLVDSRQPSWPLYTYGVIAFLIFPMAIALGMIVWPLLLSVLLIPLHVGTAIVLTAFGVPFAPASALFVKMTVEPAPPGRCACYQLTWPETREGLRHSLSYKDPRALAEIGRWLRQEKPSWEPREVV